jgi:hypothetical protein
VRALASGIGAALLASFVYGLADAIALGAKPGVLFWILLVALWKRATSPMIGAGPPARAGPELPRDAGAPRPAADPAAAGGRMLSAGDSAVHEGAKFR